MTEKYLCPECSYAYDEALGDEREGYAAGTTWDEIDPEFYCPDCGIVPKQDFIKVS